MAALVGGLVSGPGYAAEGTIRDLLAATGNEHIVYQINIGGIGNGFSWANTLLVGRGDKQLYCAPQELAITKDQYFSIFRQHAEENPSMLDFPSSARGIVLAYGLQKTFPCPE